MIVATRLSAVCQVAGAAAAALCCYLVSQSVAAERAGVAKVDRQIAQAHDDVAKLQTEIGLRARMGQLESWNSQVLKLKAPIPAQFVADGVQLASLYGRKGQPALRLDPAIVAQQGAVDRVAYSPAAPQVQSAPSPTLVAAAPTQGVAPAQPLLRSATYVRPAPDRLAPEISAQPMSAPILEKASFVTEKPPVAPRKTPASTKPAAHASHALLPDDIGLLAAREATKDNVKAAR